MLKDVKLTEIRGSMLLMPLLKRLDHVLLDLLWSITVSDCRNVRLIGVVDLGQGCEKRPYRE